MEKAGSCGVLQHIAAIEAYSRAVEACNGAVETYTGALEGQ